MMACERAWMAYRWKGRFDGAQVPPQQQGPDELHGEQLRVGAAERSVADELPHQSVQAGLTDVHAVEEVDSPFSGKPNAV